MTNLLKFNHLVLLTTWWLFLSHSTITHAADLTFTPTTPLVKINKILTLSLPDIVGSVTGVITPPSTFSLENAQWEIFTNRQWITALAVPEDSNFLWVATDGGLEKRNAQTGILSQVFTKKDGLPESSIETLLTDTVGGLWVATSTSGLAYRSVAGQWTVFNTENSGLLSDGVETLSSDGQGGLWVGTMAGLSHYQSDGKWTTIFGVGDFGLPDIWVTSFLSDNQGGLWVGTRGDLFGAYGGYLYYRNATNQWTVFDTENSPLPVNGGIETLLDDGHGGLWIGTAMSQTEGQFVGGGLVHRDANGEWTVFNSDNSGLPHNYISSLLSDSQGGLWAGTLGGGLAHLSANGEWTVSSNPHLPSKGVTSLVSDRKNGLWVGGYWGVSYFNANQKWITPDAGETNIPGNRIASLLTDGQGGLWLGTFGDGLAYRTVDNQWTIFDTRSSFPTNGILALSTDDKGGLWIGSGASKGLIHRQADGTLTVFNTENSPLPYDNVFALLNDGQEGVWIGTVQNPDPADKLVGGGLAHLNGNGQWTIFNTKNSQLPDDVVSTLLSDGQNGLWIGSVGNFSLEEGTVGGLAHLTADNQWTIFNIQNSSLPSNRIETLLSDGQNGLWIGTSYWDTNHLGGLAHLSADNQWTVFDTDNSKLPTDWVTSLSDDGEGGLWIATPKGILHRSIDNQWTLFDEENSGLPEDFTTALSSDYQGGVWIATISNGLAHLTFGRKTELCQKADAAQCQTLRTNKRASIIIAGGGAQNDNTLWDTTAFITSYLYNVLTKRGFDNDEIYYLSPKAEADFNGDGFDDRIVDAPKPERSITIEDVKAALEWAKSKGQLDSPLYLFFIDHGSDDKLQLSKEKQITATEIKAFLDDYQTATGNEVILLVDACYSGSLLQQLVDSRFRRALISSTNDTVAYFDRAEKQGFSRFFAKGLDQGMTFKGAFDYAKGEQQNLLGDISKLTMAATGKSQGLKQIPQLNDGSNGEWLGQHQFNNLSLVTRDDTLAIESTTSSSSLPVGQNLVLTAKTVGHISRVWAIVRPPNMNVVLDTNGAPILAFPRLDLVLSPETPDIWQGTWNDAIYNGNYSITFYAEDNQNNIVHSKQDAVLTVTGGIDPPNTAQVQIHLEKDRYQRGEVFKATLNEELGWGYDLYAAVLFPDGQNFMTLKNTNELRPMNDAKPWYALRKPHSPLTLFELTLPADLPTGQYCLYGILSPEQNEVFETLKKGLWVMDTKCFEVAP